MPTATDNWAFTSTGLTLGGGLAGPSWADVAREQDRLMQRQRAQLQRQVQKLYAKAVPRRYGKAVHQKPYDEWSFSYLPPKKHRSKPKKKTRSSWLDNEIERATSVGRSCLAA